MPLYAVVRNGQFIEKRRYAEDLDPSQIKHENGVPQLRPMTVIKPDFDRKTQVQEGPTIEITDTLVTETWTVRSKTAQEIEADTVLDFNRTNAQRRSICLQPLTRQQYDTFQSST
jgi:hypothetical protein